MAFYASTVHSKLVPRERVFEKSSRSSMGTQEQVPISLKRERESAQPEFARVMRNVSLNASASGGSHPTSVTTPTPPQKPRQPRLRQPRSLATSLPPLDPLKPRLQPPRMGIWGISGIS